VHPQETPQHTFRIASTEGLPLDIRVTPRIAVTAGAQVGGGNTVGFAVGFAAQIASRFPMRLTSGTTPGTVPGAVPGATRGMTNQVTLTASNEL
jgi:hypothetical protein